MKTFLSVYQYQSNKLSLRVPTACTEANVRNSKSLQVATTIFQCNMPISLE